MADLPCGAESRFPQNCFVSETSRIRKAMRLVQHESLLRCCHPIGQCPPSPRMDSPDWESISDGWSRLQRSDSGCMRAIWHAEHFYVCRAGTLSPEQLTCRHLCVIDSSNKLRTVKKPMAGGDVFPLLSSTRPSRREVHTITSLPVLLRSPQNFHVSLPHCPSDRLLC